MSIPKLRFKEFTKKWKEDKFKELFTIGGGKDYKHLNKGNIPVYGSGGIMTYVDDYIYDGNTVCIGRKGTIDKPMYLKGKFWNVDTLFYTKEFKNISNVSFSKDKQLQGKETNRSLKINDECNGKIIAVSYKDVNNPKIGIIQERKNIFINNEKTISKLLFKN